MTTIPEALALAIQHHQAGDLQSAERIYRHILAVDPGQVDALHLLGVAASQNGNQTLAIEYIRRAITLNANDPGFHNNLGNALKAAGRFDEAIAAYRRATELKPDFAEAHNNLGNTYQAQGKLDEAVACFLRAVQLAPNFAEAYNDLGNAFKSRENWRDATASYQKAIELRPDYAEPHNNVGVVFQAQGKLDDAIDSYRKALDLKPLYAEAHNNVGTVLKFQGKLDEARDSFLRALKINPDYPEAHHNLGSVFQNQGKPDEEIACYRRALELNPALVEAHIDLGAALQRQCKLDDAIDSFRRALKVAPDNATAHFNFGTAVFGQGKLDEAVASYRRALELKPDFSEAWVNLLSTLQYRPGVNLAELAAEHAEYERLRAAPHHVAWRVQQRDRDPERRLRVGFVSPNFGWHPIGFFVIGAQENLDRGQCELVCYSDRKINDPWAARFQAAATLWRDTRDLSDQELAEQVRADQIDILIDLAGHTAGNRLLTFARRPAPIQVTWADYVGTTGLAAMDYILADRYEIPPEAEVHYCERVLRMPDGYVCYDPPLYAPDVSPLPALRQGFVTFGCFNNRVKITSPIIAAWAKILNRLPQSHLVLKYSGMNDASVANYLLSEFASHGVDPRRIECLGWSTHEELLAEYNRTDLALDSFPYNGGLTTCESLWMGVPVITCPGETFASRHSLSHLSNVGMTETIAYSLDEYVDLAVSLANDLPRLSELRAGLRQRMAASPLCDGKRFAENLMHILRDVWRKWCRGGP